MNRALAIGLFFSAAAHAVILLPWSVQQHSLSFASLDSAPSSMNVALISPAPRPSYPTTSVRTHATPKLSKNALTQPTSFENTATSVNQAISAENSDVTLRSKLLTLIHTDFSRHFYYPMLARQHGWQGHVLLAFAVEPNGMISHAHIASGSGYSILDESALDALQAVQLIPQADQWLQGHRIELNLPVEYRLTGG